MSLYLRYRPSELSEIKGNTDIVQSLEKMLSNPETFPHSTLLTGKSGCGKTSLARIIASRLGCVGDDLRELNASDVNGVDTVREIIKNSQYAPLEGSCRVWIIDECFAKGTLITLADGVQKQIQDIEVGETVCNLVGKGKVNNVFKNTVRLGRVICVHLKNGNTIICSDDHLFLTPRGWVEAKNLKDNFVYLNSISKFVPDNNSLIQDKNGKTKKNLQSLWGCFKKRTEDVLLKTMSWESKSCSFGITKLCYLWEGIQNKGKSYASNLRQSLWEYTWWAETQRSTTYPRSMFTLIPRSVGFFPNGSREITTTSKFQTYEREEPFLSSRFYYKRNEYQKNQWNTTCLAWGERGERVIHTTSNFISNCFGVENGSSNTYKTTKKYRVSNLLQSRCGESPIKNSNRGRWEGTQLEERKIERLEKRGEVATVGVENITFYQQRDIGGYFKSIIGDKERNQGFVEFYDLEITNHPSYVANGVLVHNCAKMTNAAQNAFLKILEDTPKSVYFILATTDPEKLLSTIKGRCQQFQVKPLTDSQMFSLLRRIVREEGETLEQEVYDQIIQDSLCHPRNALQILEQVLSVAPERRLEMAKQTAEVQSQAIELCRALIKHESWNKVNKILVGLKGQEEETIRRIVLGYCQAILLKEDNTRAGLIMEEMFDPFYNTGFPGLVFKCYSITKN
jgi:DNA polymerase III gamma/tau subunit